MKALIVASDARLRQPMARAISGLLHTAVEIQDPEIVDAGSVVTQQKLDVVLVDLDPARGKGLEIIRRIHELQGELGPVIIAVANTPSLRLRASCLEAGATYIFDESREQEWLLESLESLQSEMGEEEERK